VTAADMAALGMTGAEIAAATPAMGATAGAGLAPGATVAAAPSWWSTLSSNVAPYIPSRETVGTFGALNTAGQGLNAAFTPQPPKASAPSLPLSGSTRGYKPTANAPIQELANAIASRRQATAQRRFA